MIRNLDRGCALFEGSFNKALPLASPTHPFTNYIKKKNKRMVPSTATHAHGHTGTHAHTLSLTRKRKKEKKDQANVSNTNSMDQQGTDEDGPCVNTHLFHQQASFVANTRPSTKALAQRTSCPTSATPTEQLRVKGLASLPQSNAPSVTTRKSQAQTHNQCTTATRTTHTTHTTHTTTTEAKKSKHHAVGHER